MVGVSSCRLPSARISNCAPVEQAEARRDVITSPGSCRRPLSLLRSAGLSPQLRRGVRHLTFCANSREFKSPATPCGNVELGIIEQGEVDPGSDFARGRLLEDEIGRSLPTLAQLALLRESPYVGSGLADRAERAAIFGGEGSGEVLGQIPARQHAGKIEAGSAQCESAVSPGGLPRPREGAHNTRERLLRSRQGLLSATGVARSQGGRPLGATLRP